MDKIDRKLIRELQRNSRMTFAKLARKIGTSKEVARYRLQKLVRDQIILESYALIDMQAIGYSRCGCLIQLKNISTAQEKEFLDFLVKNDFITYVGLNLGKWNIAFDIIYRNKEHLDSIASSIQSKLINQIESFVIIGTAVEFETFPLKVLGINDESRLGHDIRKTGIIKKNIDKIDLSILALLSNNSRVTYKELGAQFHLSANTIKNRIKTLENSGIIQGYNISIDIKKLGYEWNDIQLKLTDARRNSELKSFLRIHNKVAYFYRYIGNENWDWDIGVVTKDSSDLRQFLLLLKEKYGDSIKINDIYTIVGLSKGNHAPAGIFKQQPYGLQTPRSRPPGERISRKEVWSD